MGSFKPEPCKVCGGPVEETEENGLCFTCNTVNGTEVEEWAYINEPMNEEGSMYEEE